MGILHQTENWQVFECSWESDRIEYIDVDLFHPYLYIWSIHDCVIYNGHANGTKRDGKIISEYFKAFKANFKPATILWLIFGGLIAFMTFDIWLLRSITGTFGTVYRVILFVDHTDLRNGTDSYFCQYWHVLTIR